jgi:hypothetical protein
LLTGVRGALARSFWENVAATGIVLHRLGSEHHLLFIRLIE